MNQYLADFTKTLDLNPPERPVPGRCTGCNLKFGGQDRCNDACAKCGYQACESCAVDKTSGECLPIRRVECGVLTLQYDATLRHMLLPERELRHAVLRLETTVVA